MSDKKIKYETNGKECEIMFSELDKRISYILINKNTNREIQLINSDIKTVQEILNTFNFLTI